MDEQGLPTVEHWRAGARWAGKAERHGDVHDPATGRVSQAGGAGVGGGRGRGRRRRGGGRPGVGRGVGRPGVPAVLFAFRELLATPRQGGRGGDHAPSTARCSTTRSARCSAGWRWWSSRAGRRTCSRAASATGVSNGVDVHSLRQPLGRGRGDLAVQLPGDGAAVVRAGGDRVRQRRRAEAEREGPVGRAACWPSCGPRPGCPTACSTSCTATRRRWTRCSSIPTSRRSRSSGSTPIARYVYETGTAHGKRVQALGGAKNHMVVLPDADLEVAADAAVSAGFGSAGERCMAISVAGRGRSGGRRAGAADRARGWRGCAPGTGGAGATWARW